MKIKAYLAAAAALAVSVPAFATDLPYNYYDIMREIQESVRISNYYLSGNCKLTAAQCQKLADKERAKILARISEVAYNDTLRPITQTKVEAYLLEILQNNDDCVKNPKICAKTDRVTVYRINNLVTSEVPKPPISS